MMMMKTMLMNQREERRRKRLGELREKKFMVLEIEREKGGEGRRKINSLN